MDLPDYHGGSIVNLMASLQMGLGGDTHDYVPLRQLTPERVSEYRQVILWVIDGLGYDYLCAHPQAVHLNAALQDRMTSVYPPTTASAITTFLTGEAPQQHGLTGWFVYFKELGTILSVLPGRTRFGAAAYGKYGVDALRLLNHTPFTDRISVESFNLSPSHIVDSDFNLTHLGKSQAIGYRSLSDLCQKTLDIAKRPGERYLYLYWPELDSIGHRAGIWSKEAERHLLEIDQAFHDLCQGLNGSDTLLIVCADHGQIDSLPEQTITLNDHHELSKSLIMPLSGEPRSAYCYLRSGYDACFDEAIAQLPHGLYSNYASAKLIEDNWFGLGEPHHCLQDRVGDRVVLMHKQAMIRDNLFQEKPYQMIGVHGGLSSAELWVPLIVANC
jgi:hypothetical protein